MREWGKESVRSVRFTTVRAPLDCMLAQKHTARSKIAKYGAWEFTEYDDSFATVAWNGGRLVGMHRYVIDSRVLRSCFTWVLSSHRREGVAKRMWAHTLAREKPQIVDVSASTAEGARLLVGLSRLNPTIQWCI